MVKIFSELKAGAFIAPDGRDDGGSMFEARRNEVYRTQIAIRESNPPGNPANPLKDTAGGNHDWNDDFFPTIEELLWTILPTDAKTAKLLKPERTLQHSGKPLLALLGDVRVQSQAWPFV